MQSKDLIIKQKHLKGNDGHKYSTIRMKNKTFERLEHACYETGYSRNKLMNLFIEYGLDNYVVGNEKDTV